MHELKRNEIHFFYTCLDGIIDKTLLQRYRAVINEKEGAKVDRYVFEKDKRCCLVTRALQRFVLSLFTKKACKNFEFVDNEFGKPFLKPGTLNPPIEFNLSHSGNLTGCALTLDREIGMDIENIIRKIDLAIAHRFFSKAESDYLKNIPVKHVSEVFFDFWTLKESYIKAKGMGLSIGLDKFTFKLDQEKIGVDFDESLQEVSNQWRFVKFSPLENYKVAISIRANPDTHLKLHIYNCIPFGEIKTQGTMVF